MGDGHSGTDSTADADAAREHEVGFLRGRTWHRDPACGRLVRLAHQPVQTTWALARRQVGDDLWDCTACCSGGPVRLGSFGYMQSVIARTDRPLEYEVNRLSADGQQCGRCGSHKVVIVDLQARAAQAARLTEGDDTHAAIECRDCGTFGTYR